MQDRWGLHAISYDTALGKWPNGAAIASRRRVAGLVDVAGGIGPTVGVPVGEHQVGGGPGELEGAGVFVDDMVADGVDHLQSPVGGVIVLYISGGDVDPEEGSAYAAFFATSASV